MGAFDQALSEVNTTKKIQPTSGGSAFDQAMHDVQSSASTSGKNYGTDGCYRYVQAQTGYTGKLASQPQVGTSAQDAQPGDIIHMAPHGTNKQHVALVNPDGQTVSEWVTPSKGAPHEMKHRELSSLAYRVDAVYRPKGKAPAEASAEKSNVHHGPVDTMSQDRPGLADHAVVAPLPAGGPVGKVGHVIGKRSMSISDQGADNPATKTARRIGRIAGDTIRKAQEISGKAIEGAYRSSPVSQEIVRITPPAEQMGLTPRTGLSALNENVAHAANAAGGFVPVVAASAIPGGAAAVLGAQALEMATHPEEAAAQGKEILARPGRILSSIKKGEMPELSDVVLTAGDAAMLYGGIKHGAGILKGAPAPPLPDLAPEPTPANPLADAADIRTYNQLAGEGHPPTPPPAEVSAQPFNNLTKQGSQADLRLRNPDEYLPDHGEVPTDLPADLPAGAGEVLLAAERQASAQYAQTGTPRTSPRSQVRTDALLRENGFTNDEIGAIHPEVRTQLASHGATPDRVTINPDGGVVIRGKKGGPITMRPSTQPAAQTVIPAPTETAPEMAPVSPPAAVSAEKGLEIAGEPTQGVLPEAPQPEVPGVYGHDTHAWGTSNPNDPGIRNVESAMTASLPSMASLKGKVERGEVHPAYDISHDLITAVDALARLKGTGESLRDYLASPSMFGDAEFKNPTTPFQEEIMQWLDANARSPKKMREGIKSYSDAATLTGHPGQGTLLDSIPSPTKEELWANARASEQPGEATAAAGPSEASTDLGRNQGEAPPGPAPGPGRSAEASGGAAAGAGESGAKLTPAAPEPAKPAAAVGTPTPRVPEATSLTRSFHAGSNNGTIKFDNELQRDLYDLGAKLRGEAPILASDPRFGKEAPLRKALAEQTGLSDADLNNYARDVHDDVRAQAKGIKDGETRDLVDNVKPPAQPPSVMPKPEVSKSPSLFDVSPAELQTAHETIGNFFKSMVKNEEGSLGGGYHDQVALANAVRVVVKDAIGRGVKTIEEAKHAIVDKFGQWHDSLQPYLDEAWNGLQAKSGKSTGTQRAITDAELEKYGIDPADREAAKTIKNGHAEAVAIDVANPDAATTLEQELIKKPRATTPAETSLLGIHRMKLETAFDNAKTPAEIEAARIPLKQNDQAIDHARQHVGAGFAQFRVMVGEDLSLTTLKRRAAILNKTPTEIAKIEVEHGKLEALQKELADLKADKANPRDYKPRHTAKPTDSGYMASNKLVTKDRFAEIEARLAEKYATQRGSGPDTEYVLLTGEWILAHLEASARWGYETLWEAYRAKYPNSEKATFDAAWTEQRNDKRVAQINKRTLDAIAEEKRLAATGEEAAKQPAPILDPRTIALKEELTALREARKQAQESAIPADVKLAKAREAKLAHLDKRLENINRQLDTGEALKVGRKEFIDNIDIYMKESEVRLQEAKLREMVAPSKGLGERIYNALVYTPWNMTKGILTGFDNAWPLLQGRNMLFHQPKAWLAGEKATWKALFSEGNAQALVAEIKADPDFVLIRKAGMPEIDLDPTHTNIGAGVEEGSSYMRLAGKASKPVRNILRPFDRAFALGAYTRWKAAYRMLEWKRDEWTSGPGIHQGLIDYVTTVQEMTGRGNLDLLSAKGVKVVNAAFVAPRNTMGQIQILTRPFRKGDMFARLEAVKLLLRQGAAITAFGIAVNEAAKARGESDKVHVGLLPNDKDFWQFRNGNTRWELAPGTRTIFRTLYLVSQKLFNKQNYGQGTATDEIERFLSYKLAPGIQTVLKLNKKRLGEEDFFLGHVPTTADIVLSLVEPWNVAAIREAIQEEGIGTGIAVGVTGFVGATSNTYSSSASDLLKEATRPTPDQLAAKAALTEAGRAGKSTSAAVKMGLAAHVWKRATDVRRAIRLAKSTKGKTDEQIADERKAAELAKLPGDVQAKIRDAATPADTWAIEPKKPIKMRPTRSH